MFLGRLTKLLKVARFEQLVSYIVPSVACVVFLNGHIKEIARVKG
jgi:hypothetical protein